MRSILRLSRSQRMNPTRGVRRPYIRTFSPDKDATVWEWVCEETGLYSILLWGPGGQGHWTSGDQCGSCGALAVLEKARITRGEKVWFTLLSLMATTGDVQATFSSGRQPLICTRPQDADIGSGLGIATGGTININGIASTSTSSDGPTGPGTDGGRGGIRGAPGGPGYLGFRGGNGPTGADNSAGHPGAGGIAGQGRRGGRPQAVVIRED